MAIINAFLDMLKKIFTNAEEFNAASIVEAIKEFFASIA